MDPVSKGLSLLFDRMGEPLIIPKGDDGVVFELPDDYLAKEYIDAGYDMTNRMGKASGKEVITVDPLEKKPELSLALQLAQDAEFSLFIPYHREMANELIQTLLDIPENELPKFLSTCAFARENCNSELFHYCYCVALMNRSDTKKIPIPSFAKTFPYKFFSSTIFTESRQNIVLETLTKQAIPIIIPRDFTATDLDIEHRMAYFREDLGINLHHWYWHIVYPFSGPLHIIKKDRRGELFFYMHQQIVARYNGERLNNMLSRVKKFNNWREPIPEGYYPKLDNLTASRGYAPRQGHMKWQDVHRAVDRLDVTVEEMQKQLRNVEEAIAMGIYRKDDGSVAPLDIDTLGNIVEASELSPNKKLYGNLHNNGHVMTGYIHDPLHHYLENIAVMGIEATTMRDPFFYRWHAFIDDLFQKFKESDHVPEYTEADLSCPGVSITSVRIEDSTGDVNKLKTHWSRSTVNVSGGLDFSNRAAVNVSFVHLNHRNFTYSIEVNNTGAARRATCRIFMAPKYDERKLPWILSDQRKMFIEMDKFVVELKEGENKLQRKSTESSITIPFEQTFREVSTEEAADAYCGCGWPQHMLVPRGTTDGAVYDLFVMMSNYEGDSVNNPDGSEMSCKKASSFCGLKDMLYPDRRAMGFPFDRPSRTTNKIEKFILPNMALIDVTIELEDVEVSRDTDQEK